MGLHSFCDMTQPKYCFVVRGPFHPSSAVWCKGLNQPLPFGEIFSQSLALKVMSNWKEESRIQCCPPGLPGISDNSLEIVQIFVCLLVHSPYLLKLQNANEMSFYL